MEEKPLLEKCGIIGIYNTTYASSLPLALLAASGVQHRGQLGAGIALQTKKGLKRYVGNGLLKEVFPEKIIQKYNKENYWTMVHCRYGTFGGYDVRNLQPCVVNAKNGMSIVVIHNGEFTDVAGMRKLIKKQFPADISDTYLFAQLLAETEGISWEHRLIIALSKVKGAYSLIIGIGDTLFVARDEFGIRPLVLGQINEDKWIVASETHALDKVGARIVREIKKGEILRINQKGISVVKRGGEGMGNFCDFEWAYFARPTTLFPTHEQDDSRNAQAWLSVSHFRERCGEMIAQESPILKATFVCGSPDSGIAVASGYASALRIPYRQAIIRDHFDPNGNYRLFMGDNQKRRIKKKVLGKLSLVPDKRVWQDAIVVIGDDSIVRGNVTAKVTKSIFAMGAKEVHWIIGFPPVTHTCHLGVSMRTREELIAAQYKADPVRIAKKIGATSVRYISHKGFIKARLLSGKLIIPEEMKNIFLMNGGCGGCITGQYPITKTGVVHTSLIS